MAVEPAAVMLPATQVGPLPAATGMLPAGVAAAIVGVAAAVVGVTGAGVGVLELPHAATSSRVVAAITSNRFP